MKKRVYVISKDGRPLMPCEPAVARLLLKQGKAKVKRRCPFTIKLNYQTETGYVQECTIAEDTGSGTLGAAAVTGDGKVLYMSEVAVRNDIKAKMDERRRYRRSRRSRKTRYRKARFMNRAGSRRKGRLTPTMESKLRSHKKEIAFIRSILPCREDRVILETGAFDPAALEKPWLRSDGMVHWAYQKGPDYGFANTKAMVLARDGHKCQCCKGRSEDRRLEVRHIVFRSEGGSDKAENLITLCKSCHDAVRRGEITPGRKGKRKGTLLFATQMNAIRSRLLKNHPEAVETFGYVTKENRQALGLPKRRCIDAAVAASGQTVRKPRIG